MNKKKKERSVIYENVSCLVYPYVKTENGLLREHIDKFPSSLMREREMKNEWEESLWLRLRDAIRMWDKVARRKEGRK